MISDRFSPVLFNYDISSDKSVCGRIWTFGASPHTTLAEWHPRPLGHANGKWMGRNRTPWVNAFRTASSCLEDKVRESSRRASFRRISSPAGTAHSCAKRPAIALAAPHSYPYCLPPSYPLPHPRPAGCSVCHSTGHASYRRATIPWLRQRHFRPHDSTNLCERIALWQSRSHNINRRPLWTIN